MSQAASISIPPSETQSAIAGQSENKIEIEKVKGDIGAAEVALNYHNSTKHSFNSYAPGPKRLEWSNQPSPFRKFSKCSAIHLRVPEPESLLSSIAYPHLYSKIETHAEKLSPESISYLLFHSFALSAIKKSGQNAWQLRVNPSSGNLHPTEVYLCLPLDFGQPEEQNAEPKKIDSYVYHYNSEEHALHRRASLTEDLWLQLKRDFQPDTFFVAFSSITWREAWKYGSRAYRYCNHDVGHAIGALRFACEMVGWKMFVIDSSILNPIDISQMFGLDRKGDFHKFETEEPDVLVAIVPHPTAESPFLDSNKQGAQPLHNLRETAHAIAEKGIWKGKAEPLTQLGHVKYDSIEKLSNVISQENLHRHASRLTSPESKQELVWNSSEMLATESKREKQDMSESSFYQCTESETPSSVIIRRRRSVWEMDGNTHLKVDNFYSMLSRLVPALSSVPWSSVTWKTNVHLVVFAHRVENLDLGVYILPRSTDEVSELKRQFSSECTWISPPGCPSELQFFQLLKGDSREWSARVSCFQGIAGDGCFSLGMIAPLADILKEGGALAYKRIHWEAGLIGQVLYLESEANGLSGTGIGCFFDNESASLMKINESSPYQVIYHFAVGGPEKDERIQIVDPYQDQKHV